MNSKHAFPTKQPEAPMDKEQGEAELARRNNRNAMEAILEMNNRISALHDIMMEQQQGIRALVEQVANLQRQVDVQRAVAAGHGPTELKHGAID